MRRDWRRVAADAIRRNDHRNAVAGAVAGVGAAIAIGDMEWFSLESHYPLLVRPPRERPISWRSLPAMQDPCWCTRTMEVSIICTAAS
jgi:hypothetical protein